MKNGKHATNARGEGIAESDKMFRNLAEQSPNMIFINKKGRIVYFNKKCEEIMGYTKDDFFSSEFDFLDLIAPDSVEEVRSHFSKHIKGEEIAPYESVLITKGSNRIPVIITTKLMDYKGEKAILGIITDITALKKVEDELRIKDYAVASTINAIAFSDLDGKLTYVNSSFLEMWGFDRGEEVLNKQVTSFWEEENKANEVVLALKASGSWVGELIAKRKDKSTFIAQLSTSTVKNADGEIIGMMASFIDITDRKQAELALKKSEERYRQLVENLSEGIWAIDKNARTTYVNPRMAEILGYTASEMAGKHLFTFMDERGVELAAQHLERREQGIQERHEFEFLKKDGTRVYTIIDTSPLRDDEGNYAGAIAAVADITKEKEREKALLESEKKFRELAEKSPNLIFINKKGRVVYANEQCEHLTGYSRKEFYASEFDFFSLIAPEYREMVQKIFFKHLRGEETGSIEYALVTKTGKKISAIYTSKLIEYEGERAILGIITEITEIKQMEKLLREQKEETALFLDIITHDLRNFHFTAKAYLDRALRKSVLPEETNIWLRKSISGLTRANNLLESISILMRQKIDVKYDLQPVNILDEVEKAKRTARELFPEKNINISTENIPPDCYIRADSLFDQLLLNLLTNAVKNDDKKVVKIEISAEKNEEKSTCLMKVTDYGKGIPEDRREDIFDRFTEFRKKGEGSGLGLHIVKTLVERYQGKIWIENRITGDHSKGTSFVIELSKIGLRNLKT
ncbi:MAG: PAS domain S-box protein [Candidatus Odinarchaeota archaeon]